MILLSSKVARHAAAFLVALAVAACAPAEATDDAEYSANETTYPADAAALDAKAMLETVEAKVETARDKFMQLAEAMPESGWDYRPMDGVRSFGDVLLHIAADNWIAVEAGATPPSDIPARAGDLSWLGPYQAQQLSREEVLDHLTRSFEFFFEAMDGSRDRLDETVSLAGQEWTLARLWVELTTHMHEHLGQLVAYARANEVVPPWSN